MNLKIPICYWGGEPIRVINGEESLNREDIRTLKKWGDFLSDPAKGEQPWIDGLSQGRTWLELPSADAKRRLLLRVFRRDIQGSRPLWFFSAFAFDVALAEPAIWAAATRRLLVLTEKNISEAKGCIELDRIDPNYSGGSGPPLGTVFRGSYGSALDKYCEALAGSQWHAINGLFTASHPPACHPEFTTLLIADDFCYQGIRLVEQAAPAAPEPKPQTGTKVNPSKTARTQHFLLRFKMPMVVAAFFITVGFLFKAAQSQSDQDALELENKDLRAQIEDLRAQIKNLSLENQKIENDNRTPKKQLPGDSPSKQGRRANSPEDDPN
jgi:cell division protein FtsB